MRRLRRRQAGFSLVETFIASVILFIALVGLSVVTTASAANNRMASLTVDAERLASSYASRFASLGVAGIQTRYSTAVASTGTGWKTLDNRDTLDPSGRTIHILVEAADVSASVPPDETALYSPVGGVCMQLRITVSWRNAIGRTQTQTHNTFVSQNA